MKKLILAGVLLTGASGIALADGFSISIGDEPRWRHHHHRYDDSCYRCYDHPRDYYRPRYSYRGGYFRDGVWIPRERVVINARFD